jgi:hypothetical protein
VRTWALKGETPVVQFYFTWHQLLLIAGMLDQASNFLFRKAELEDRQKICSTGNRVHSR